MRRMIACGPVAAIFMPLLVSAQAAGPATPEAKVQGALSAAPAYIARDAAVWDWPQSPQDAPVVLRAGSNGWTCFPAQPDTPTNAPVCMDEVILQVRLAELRGEEARVDRVGIRYMLQGAGADDQGRRTLGPHVMISLPAGVSSAEWIGDSHGPDGPWVTAMDGGTVIIVPVAPAGASVR